MNQNAVSHVSSNMNQPIQDDTDLLDYELGTEIPRGQPLGLAIAALILGLFSFQDAKGDQLNFRTVYLLFQGKIICGHKGRQMTFYYYYSQWHCLPQK